MRTPPSSPRSYEDYKYSRRTGAPYPETGKNVVLELTLNAPDPLGELPLPGGSTLTAAVTVQDRNPSSQWWLLCECLDRLLTWLVMS